MLIGNEDVGQLCFEVERLIFLVDLASDGELDLFAGVLGPERMFELSLAHNRLAVDRGDDIAGFDARFGCRTVRWDSGNLGWQSVDVARLERNAEQAGMQILACFERGQMLLNV